MLKRFGLFVVIAFLFPAVLVQGSTEERTIHKTFPLEAGGTISLKNVNGDITIQAWDKNEVDVKATKRGPANNLELVEIEMNATPQLISIESRYPHYRNNIDVSVTYELMVPRLSTLDEINNVNGGIDISGVEGRLRVSTVNGSTEITGIKSTLDAESVNGGIIAKWSAFPKEGSVNMETVNGKLDLRLPAEINADVEASSMNGSMSTDYPVTVEKGLLSRKIHGRIGSGGVTINLKTVNGGISLSRL